MFLSCDYLSNVVRSTYEVEAVQCKGHEYGFWNLMPLNSNASSGSIGCVTLGVVLTFLSLSFLICPVDII